MNRSTSHSRRLVLGGLVLLIGLTGCLRQAASPLVPPMPQPVANELQQLSDRAFKEYAAGLADQFAATAAAIQRGEMTTAEAAHQQLIDRNRLTREQAFESLSAALNDAIGENRWEPARATRTFQEFSAAFRRTSERITP